MHKYHKGPNIYVDQVVLKVEDIQSSAKFYEKIMGFKILEKKDKEIIFTANGNTPLITIIQPNRPIPKLPKRTGLYHIALLLPSRVDLGLFLKHIGRSNYPIIGGSNHGVSEAIYLEDIDGNGIEVYSDLDSDSWKREEDRIEMVTEPVDYKGLLKAAGEQNWNGVPEKTIIGHIHLHVGDLNLAKEFYCEGLGFDLVMEMGGSALFISSGGYHHHIGLNIWNGKNAPPLPENSAGMLYYTLVFPNEKLRNNRIEVLERLGYKTVKKNDEIYIKDPSENLIKLEIGN